MGKTVNDYPYDLSREEILNMSVSEYCSMLSLISFDFGYSDRCRGSKLNYCPHQLAWDNTYGWNGYVSEERYIHTIHYLTYRMGYKPLSYCP